MVTRLVKRPPAPWISEEIKRAMTERDNIQKDLKLNENAELRRRYKEKKKEVISKIYKAKSKYYREEFHKSKGNSKKTWNTIKMIVSNTGNKYDPSNIPDIDRKIEEFNNFFANVGRQTYEKTSSNTLLNENTISARNNLESMRQGNLFRPQPVTVETVILTFKTLNETNAVGKDDIPYRFVRDSFPVIAFYLTVIINTSIVTGAYPRLWKHGNLVPGHKSGDVEDPSNYRPISILCVLSKLLEKVIANQLVNFLEHKKLLSHTQHGFRSGLSTETALISVTNKL